MYKHLCLVSVSVLVALGQVTDIIQASHQINETSSNPCYEVRTAEYSYGCENIGFVGSNLEHVEALLKSISECPKSFVNDFEFNYHEFETNAEDIHHHVITLDYWIQNTVPFNHTIRSRLTFVKQMSLVMQDSANCVAYFNIAGTPASLIRYTARLNVWLLKLYNDFGFPDQTNEKYSSLVLRYSLLLKEWSDIFRSFENVPPLLSLAFSEQESRATNTLYALSECVQLGLDLKIGFN